MRRELKRKPTHPGEILKQHYMVPLKLNVSAVAKAIGVSRKTVSMLVNERCGITPDVALRLSIAFNTSARLWLNLQQTYDLWMVAHRSSAWKKVHPVSMPRARAA